MPCCAPASRGWTSAARASMSRACSRASALPAPPWASWAGGPARLLQDGLQELGIGTDFVWVAGETRTNISIVTESHDHYIKVNEKGPLVEAAKQDELLAKIDAITQPGDWWVLAGSLPPGVSEDFYARIVAGPEPAPGQGHPGYHRRVPAAGLRRAALPGQAQCRGGRSPHGPAHGHVRPGSPPPPPRSGRWAPRMSSSPWARPAPCSRPRKGPGWSAARRCRRRTPSVPGDSMVGGAGLGA